MNGKSNIPSIEISDNCVTVQKLHGYDGSTLLSLDHLEKLFDSTEKRGHDFNYHLTKRRIINKEHLYEKVHQIFFHDKVKLVDVVA